MRVKIASPSKSLNVVMFHLWNMTRAFSKPSFRAFRQ